MASHSTDGEEPASGAPAAGTLQFHYIKSNYFRVVHADGAVGGLTPSGMIHVALYNERPAIPKSVSHIIDEAGNLGRRVETDSRTGFVREIEVDTFITVATAESLVDWLQHRIDEARTRLQSLAASSEEE